MHNSKEALLQKLVPIEKYDHYKDKPQEAIELPLEARQRGISYGARTFGILAKMYLHIIPCISMPKGVQKVCRKSETTEKKPMQQSL